jgi:quercetin dioxygenase-like cupin family protein
MLRRTVLLIIGLTALLTVLIANALATPASTTIVVQTARGSFAKDLKLETEFTDDVEVEIETDGPIELITQRIEAPPGATFGWHSHPGENVNVILQGTLTLYHDEKCTKGIEYGLGTAFPTSPDQIHLARNLGTESVVFFATYFAPKKTPPLPVRLDAPLPGPGCPQ